MSEGGNSLTLIETVAVRGGQAPLWPLHLARLRRSADNLGLRLPEVVARPTGGGDHIVRYAITPDRVQVSGRPLVDRSELRLVSAAVVHQGYPDKTSAREWLDEALRQAQAAGYDDSLLVNPAGWLVEAANWAVGWWDADGLVFPPLSLGGLRSVSRQRLEEMLSVSTCRIRPENLGGRSLIACNAARGIVPVRCLGQESLPLDPRTSWLQQEFWERPPA